jgi:phosphatidylglycerol lysyltransferase
VVVAEREGRIVGFIVATPIPVRSGWLIEQIVRGHGAPNGTAELMLHDVAAMIEQEGARIVTLGLAPLAKRGTGHVQNAPHWLFALLHALRAHGTRFYNFTGLESFKSKFGGETWETVYATTAPETSLPRALIAVTEAFSAESIGRFMFRTVWRSVRARVVPRFHDLSDQHPSPASSSARA